ncbi:MAG TPA: c-type cytochrome [Thermodesulfovibrionales bacterium]|nr:c-type cytochrome [Thermodesulfovibrionales bacterium]
MKKVITTLVVAAVSIFVTAVFAKEEAKAKAGEELFKKHCVACHPDGGNIINPQKTLHKKDLDANNIKRPADIINKMRNPGPGMTKFDEATISDKEAREIAAYVMKAFK